MAQVPYDPTPNVEPSSQGVHISGIETPPAAFGVNIARAVEGLGSTLEQSGEKLANRALAIQHDKNVADADAADVELMKQVGLEHAKFNALEGDERVKAFPSHIENLEKIRSDVRGQLTNVDARNMYDRQSRNTIGRTIFNAAGAAASAQRQYEKNTTAAVLGVTTQSYADDPTEANLAKIDQKARELAVQVNGGSLYDPIAEDAARKAVSHAILKNIQTVARNDAPTANKIMTNNDGRLTADDKVVANNLVTAQATTQYAELISNDAVRNGQETPTKGAKSLNQIEDDVRAAVKKYDPKGTLPMLEKTAIADAQRKYNQAKYANKVDSDQRVQDITGIIMQNNPLSISELIKDPKAASIYDQMDNKEKLQVQGTINRWYKARDEAQNSENYRTLRGMASDNTEKFMSIPPSEWKVNQSDWKNLYSIRDKILRGNGQYNDPRVNKAMTWLTDKFGETLDNARVIGKNKDDKNVHLFRGSLAVAIDQWQEDHPGKALTAKDVQETIWGQLRGETREERSFKDFFGTGVNIPYGPDRVTPNWKMQLSKDPQLREQLTQEIMKRSPTTYTPTEEELRIEYMRNVWRQFSPSYKKPE